MHAVVDHLPIKAGADWSAFAARFGAFEASARQAHPGLAAGGPMRATDSRAILVAVYRDRRSLDEISKSAAAPGFAENVRPYLSGPVSRPVGEIIAGSAVPVRGRG